MCHFKSTHKKQTKLPYDKNVMQVDSKWIIVKWKQMRKQSITYTDFTSDLKKLSLLKGRLEGFG